MKKLFYLSLLFFISKANGQTSYYIWPVGDGLTQIKINGVLNEYSDVSGRWLHDGFDINYAEGTNIYPVDHGTVATTWSHSNHNHTIPINLHLNL